MSGRKSISQIVAALLLIAISVAGAITIYVFVSGLSGNLTQSGGQQVSEQISMDAYNFATLTAPTLVIRNTGPTTVSISAVYFDGNLCQASGSTCTAAAAFTTAGGCTGTAVPVVCTTGQYAPMTLTVTSQTAGTSHLVKVVTATGGTFTFSIIAGRSG